ncbi:MAG TPA: hypothetical protein H9986_07765 [Candidatus Prevotella stercoripullorum]|nr:hypothetical protein [Candidatus Prevotella stercoripullorum]
MDDLKEIYERIKFLRGKGVKMKEIAAQTGFTPSVLSALFTTVMPEYFKNKDKGMPEDEALDGALVWVNNVSKKKLLGQLDKMKAAIFAMDAAPTAACGDSDNMHRDIIAHAMKGAVNGCTAFSGMYMSYSVSSSSSAMKIEPYLITPSADGGYIEVVHNNAYGSTHHGFALMNGLSHMYIMFNENRPPQLALFSICLKLPMYERPPYLRGIYTCLDYNHNPIARRILFVKASDGTSREDFLNAKGCLKQYEELDDRERLYYKYTCGGEDVVRMRDVPAPRMTDDDLLAEKELLAGGQ